MSDHITDICEMEPVLPTLTREEIEAFPAGPTLDAIIGQAAGIKPHVKWFVYAADGIATCYESLSQDNCQRWLDEQQRDGRLLTYHVGDYKSWPRFSRDLSAASLLLTHTKWYEMAKRPTGAAANCTGHPADTVEVSYDDILAIDPYAACWLGEESLREQVQALALCRAWLVSLPYQPEGFINQAHEKSILREYRERIERAAREGEEIEALKHQLADLESEECESCTGRSKRKEA
jgi:hypothetical protein